MRKFAAIALATTALVAGSAGCASVTSAAGALFNPDFLALAGVGSQVASLPGDAPALLIGLENRTAELIEIRVTWRDSEGNITARNKLLGTGQKLVEAVICPVDELTAGDVGNLESIGARVIFGTGLPDDPFIEVEPFGVLLQDGANYDCGDAVTFAVVPSVNTRSGYQLFAFIERASAVAP